MLQVWGRGGSLSRVRGDHYGSLIQHTPRNDNLVRISKRELHKLLLSKLFLGPRHHAWGDSAGAWAKYVYIIWIEEGFTAEPPRNDSGGIFREMIRVSARKSELQAKSRSDRPKVGVTVGQTARIRTKSPRKGTRIGFRRFCRKPPLKAFLNPANVYTI